MHWAPVRQRVQFANTRCLGLSPGASGSITAQAIGNAAQFAEGAASGHRTFLGVKARKVLQPSSQLVLEVRLAAQEAFEKVRADPSSR